MYTFQVIYSVAWFDFKLEEFNDAKKAVEYAKNISAEEACERSKEIANEENCSFALESLEEDIGFINIKFIGWEEEVYGMEDL